MLYALLVAVLLSATDDNETLWAAARKGDAETVKSVLAKGIDPNVRTPYGATALTFASDHGHVEVVKLLLQGKADVNARDKFYFATPLTWALMRKHWDIIKLLVEAGATGAEGVLTTAASEGNTDVVRFLIEKAKVRPEGLTAALRVAPADKPKVRELLLKAGAKPETATPAAKPTLDASGMQAFVGSYENSTLGTFVVAVVEGKLRLQSEGRNVMELAPAEKDLFKAVGNDGVTITFQRDGDNITGFLVKSPMNTTLFKRGEPRKEAEVVSRKPLEDKQVRVERPLNWPSFRGSGATGVADGQHPPATWNVASGRHIRWKTALPGLGHACPIVWGDQVFITTAASVGGDESLKVGQYGDVDAVNDNAVHRFLVLCLDKRTGKVVWERLAHEGVPRIKRHTKATHANSTPVTDGRHLIACFGSEGLFCYDLDGRLLWKRDLGMLDSGWFYNPEYQWGFGSSPILYRDLVIVQCDVGKGSYLAAFHVSDGTQVWTTPREEIPSWGSPTVCVVGDQAELVTNGTKAIRGYDPLTGRELWRLTPNSEVTVPTPFVAHGLIYVTSGYRPIQPIYAIRPGGRGDLTLKNGAASSEHLAWMKPAGGPYMPTPIVYGDYLYTCANSGMLTAYEATTGKRLYQERMGGRGGYTASPVAADGRLYFFAEEGDVRVVKAGPKYELLATNKMDEICMATPAIADGLLIVRTLRHLVAIGY